MKTKGATNQEIISSFRKAAAVLKVIDKGPFRVRAYENAIETIENLDEEISYLSQKIDLDTLPGIGQELASKMVELATHGRSSALDNLYAKVPQGMFSLLDVPGVGAKRAYQLSIEFDLNDEKKSLTKLKELAKDNKLQKLPGFGPKLESQILKNIQRKKPKTAQLLLSEADSIAAKIIEHLTPCSEVLQIDVLGSVRRRKETVRDVDIGIATNKPRSIIDFVKKWHYIDSMQVSGDQVIRLVLPGNIQADIKMIPEKEYGSMLQHFTGSKLHNVALREKSIKMGKSLSEHGIKYQNKIHRFSKEPEFYSFLEMQYIPPEMRENTGEIEVASRNDIPRLIEQNDILGDFHTHTNYKWASSHDYGEKVASLLTTSTSLGYKWLSLSDHNLSRSTYNKEEITQEIDKRTRWIEDKYSSWKQSVKNHNVQIFNSLEIDILKNGELAIPANALKHLDFVIASIHSGFDYSQKNQTSRIVNALSHHKVKILGHPTGRLINKRTGIAVDWEVVFKYCQQNSIALEINASPERLDLPDSLVKEALKYNIKFALSTDSHQSNSLHNMRYAIDTARRGWAKKSDILNTYSYKELNNWLNN